MTCLANFIWIVWFLGNFYPETSCIIVLPMWLLQWLQAFNYNRVSIEEFDNGERLKIFYIGIVKAHF